jgi:DNA (cytosine-5)-methyltransferase 1
MKKLKMIDLFSGGGGFSYAAEKLVGGYETIQFVEIDSYCQKVLKKHWPTVPIHDDIKTYKPKPYSADVVVGGFPCTDISIAGKKLGITKETRSGLFYELMRVVCVVRPKYVILENVAAILNNGMGIVLGELCKARFDAEWATFRASDFVRACHHRDRWWLIATNRDFANTYNNGSSSTEKSRGFKKTNGRATQRKDKVKQFEGSSQPTNSRDIQINASNTDSKRLERETKKRICRTGLWPAPTRHLYPEWWNFSVEPTICRASHGPTSELLANRANRLKLLGNGLIPQCAAIPLQRVLDLENES